MHTLKRRDAPTSSPNRTAVPDSAPDTLVSNVADHVLHALTERERKLDAFADPVADKLRAKQAISTGPSANVPGTAHLRKQRPRDPSRDRLLGHGGPSPAQAVAEVRAC
jgi:hypothetical protein